MDSSGLSAAPGWYPDPAGRHQYRLWSGSAWTGYVSSNGQAFLEQNLAPSSPAASAPHQSALTKPLPAQFTKRVLWSIYAIPITLLFLAASIRHLHDSPWYVVDAIVSLPQFVIVQLYIWDKRVLRPILWQIYAICFLAWQLTFSLVIEPTLTHIPVGPSLLVGLGLQLPMLVAMFLYAFGSWDDQGAVVGQERVRCRECHREFTGKGPCPYCGRKPARPRVSALVLALVSVLAIAAVAYGTVRIAQVPGAILKSALSQPPSYEVSVAPPSDPSHGPVRPGLSDAEESKLRSLFVKGDFDSLNTSLEAVQHSFEASQVNDARAVEAFTLFARASDQKQLDAWVGHSPSSYAPYLARAAFFDSAAWNARGSGWTGKTSASQFKKMDEYFDKAIKDADAALAINPNLFPAYEVRLDAANAGGTHAQEDAVVAQGTARFPHSYVWVTDVLFAKEPRWGGSYPEMEAFTKRALDRNRGEVGFYKPFGLIYSDEADWYTSHGRNDKALALLLRASSYGEGAPLYLARGWAYFRNGNDQAAIFDASQIINQWGGSTDSYYLRASVYVDQGNADAALRDIAASEALYPADADLIKLKAKALRMQSDMGTL